MVRELEIEIGIPADMSSKEEDGGKLVKPRIGIHLPSRFFESSGRGCGIGSQRYVGKYGGTERLITRRASYRCAG